MGAILYFMLTKSDLKAIDELIVKRVTSIVGEELEEKLEEKLDEKLDSFARRELDPIKKDIVQIRKDSKTIVDYFDREYLGLRTRVERIERIMNLSPLAD